MLPAGLSFFPSFSFGYYDSNISTAPSPTPHFNRWYGKPALTLTSTCIIYLSVHLLTVIFHHEHETEEARPHVSNG